MEFGEEKQAIAIESPALEKLSHGINIGESHPHYRAAVDSSGREKEWTKADDSCRNRCILMNLLQIVHCSPTCNE